MLAFGGAGCGSSSNDGTTDASHNTNATGYVAPDIDFSHLKNNPPKYKLSGSNSVFVSSADEFITLPERYDLRDYGRVTPVKNQNPYGTCWAFSAIAACESNYLTKNLTSLGSVPDLSELHMAWFVYRDPEAGYSFSDHASATTLYDIISSGNEVQATAYLARMSGPVNEESLPYTLTQDENSALNELTGKKTSDYPRAALRLLDAYMLRRSYEDIDESERDIIKNLIMEHGSVVVTYDAGDGATSPEGGATAYFDADKNSTNHAVLLVGWDDNFSRENFNEYESLRPQNNGAWIVKNSWGDTWPRGRGDGYFYLSYEQYVVPTAVFIVDECDSSMKHYDYDALGMVKYFGYGAGTPGWAANVFQASENENLQSVGFYTTDNNSEYEIYVFDLGTNKPSSPVPSSFGQTEPLAKGEQAFMGYHTAILSSPVNLEAGHYFSVIVKTITPLFATSIAVESEGTNKHPVVNAGESYFAGGSTSIPAASRWTDGTAFSGMDPMNACIKAFTVKGSSAPISEDVNMLLIDASSFPDENFRAYVSYYCDTDGNGYLSEEEIQNVRSIAIDSSDITSLNGIEHFTNLHELYCSNNSLKELDLSRNMLLEILFCNDNQLTSIDLSNCVNLRRLYCERNNLTALEVSSCAILEELAFRYNTISEIDVSRNAYLKVLNCPYNNLSELDLSNNLNLEILDCGSNDLEELDVSNNLSLKELWCFRNNISDLYVGQNSELTYLDCGGNNLNFIDVSDNLKLTTLECYRNQITELDVSQNALLKYLDCGPNKLTRLDVSNNTALEYLDCYSNLLTELILGNNSCLTYLDCENNNLTTVNIDGCPNLETFVHDDFDTVKPSFTTHALVLSGQIGAFFYTDLPEIAGVDYSASYMTFDINGDTTSNNPRMFDPELTNSTGTYYGFVCYVSSVQMADPIIATLHYGDNLTVEHNYSVKEYLDTIIEKTQSDAMRNLAKAMKDYGHYMQVYLARKNGWEIGTKHVAMDYANVYTDSDVEEVRQLVNDFAIVRDTKDSEIEKVTFALELDSETIIDVYLKPKDGYSGDVEAYLDDSTTNIASPQSDGRYLIQIDGVSAHLLGNTYKIKVKAGSEFEIRVSALSYVNSILNSASSATDLKQAVTSLYDYYAATMGYRQSLQQ